MVKKISLCFCLFSAFEVLVQSCHVARLSFFLQKQLCFRLKGKHYPHMFESDLLVKKDLGFNRSSNRHSTKKRKCGKLPFDNEAQQ